MKDKYRLTVEEVAWIDEVNADMRANEQTFTLAMNYHINQMSRLDKEKRKFWEQMAQKMGYDSLEDAPRLRIKPVEGAACAIIDPFPIPDKSNGDT